MIKVQSCVVCNKSVSVKPSYDLADVFWDQHYCEVHLEDGTHVCYSCGRIMPKYLTDYNLGDGRYLCSDCIPISIMSGEQINSLIADVSRFFKDINLKTDIKRIPVFLVKMEHVSKVCGKYQFNEDNVGEVSCVSSKIYDGSHSSKICIEEVIKCVQPVGNNIRGVAGKTRILKRTNSILLLFGLSRANAGTLLVYNMMHRWLLTQDSAKRLSHRAKDGLCIVAALKWLESTSFIESSCTHEQAKFAGRVKKYVTNALHLSSASPGLGWGKVKPSIDKLGFKYMLTYLDRYRKFPSETELDVLSSDDCDHVGFVCSVGLIISCACFIETKEYDRTLDEPNEK